MHISASAPGKGRFNTASDVAAALLEDELVATIPGDSFGAPRNLRVTYACSTATIEKGVERVRRFISKPA